METRPYHCKGCGYWESLETKPEACPKCHDDRLVDLLEARPQLPDGHDFLHIASNIEPSDLYWNVWPNGGDGPAWLFAAALMGGPNGSTPDKTDAEGRCGQAWLCRRTDGRGPEALAQAFLGHHFGVQSVIASGSVPRSEEAK